MKKKNKSEARAVQMTWFPVSQMKLRLSRDTNEYYGDRFSKGVMLADSNNKVIGSSLYRWDYRDELWVKFDYSNLPDRDARKDVNPEFFAKIANV